MRTQRSRPVKRQQGAIAILAAAFIVIALIAAALAVDFGRLSHQQRRLQGIADAAALDAARIAGPCSTAAAPAAAVRAEAIASAARNGFTQGQGRTVEATVGVAQLGPNHVYLPHVRPPAGAEVANAVEVVVTDARVPRSLLAGFLFDERFATLSASAIARNDAIGGLRAGSRLAGLDSKDAPVLNALLSGLLGGEVELDVSAYTGLIGSSLTLLELLDAHAGVGRLEQLLSTDLKLSELLGLMALALESRGDPVSVTLNELALLTIDRLQITLGELLELAAVGEREALELALNAFDLLMTAAQAANIRHAVEIPSLGLSLPGIASIGATLTVIEPPKLAAGPPGRDASGAWRTAVQTAQVRLQLDIAALDRLNLLGLVQAKINLNVFIEAAQTTAALDRISCPSLGQPQARALVAASPGVARIGIGTFAADGTLEPSRVVDAKLLVVPVTITAEADVNVAAPAPRTLEFHGPFVPAIPVPSTDNTQTVGAELGAALGNALADLLMEAEIKALGIDLSLITAPLGAILSPIVASLDILLVPLLEALGISVGGADVTVILLETTQPELIR